MAVTRPGGSIGGAGGKSIATTRLDVVDPHILIMMRDVMDSAETAVRLKPSGFWWWRWWWSRFFNHWCG